MGDARALGDQDDTPGAYPDAAAFIDDLELMDASLARHRGEHAGRFALRRILWRARIPFWLSFGRAGFARDSAVHDDALAALLADTEWAARRLDQRVAQLHALIERVVAVQPDAAALTWMCSAVQSLRGSLGKNALGLTSSAWRVPLPMRWRCWRWRALPGCTDAGEVPLDVAPLFETVADLEAAPG